MAYDLYANTNISIQKYTNKQVCKMSVILSRPRHVNPEQKQPLPIDFPMTGFLWNIQFSTFISQLASYQVSRWNKQHMNGTWSSLSKEVISSKKGVFSS